MTIYLTPQQLAWLAQAFLAASTDVKIQIDPEATFEQQLADLGAFDQEITA